MNRHLLGLAALFLLLVGGAIAWQQPEGGAVFAGACVRVGMVLGALWLALPQIGRFWRQTPKWLLIAAGVALVIVVIHPIYALAAVPLLAGLWFFGPKVAGLWKPKASPPNTSQSTPAVATAEQPAKNQPVRQAPRPRRRSNAR